VSHDEAKAKDLVELDDGAKPLRDPRRERFCQEVVSTNSERKAFELVGFKRARGNVQRLMRDPKITARLAYLWRQATMTTAIMGGRVLEQLSLVANANIFDFIDVDPKYGTTKVNLGKVEHVLGSLIQEISHDSKGRLKIKLYDKVAVLKFLAERAADAGKSDEAQAANINVNMQLLQMVTKFDGMSEYDAVRRIVFAMEAGMRNSQKLLASEAPAEDPAPPALNKDEST
jgi:hypothetical protein